MIKILLSTVRCRALKAPIIGMFNCLSWKVTTNISGIYQFYDKTVLSGNDI